MANVSQVKAQFATDITATATATIAALQTLGGAGNMTLTGAAATFGGTGSSQKVSLTCGADMSTVTFTITGTDSIAFGGLQLKSTNSIRCDDGE